MNRNNQCLFFDTETSGFITKSKPATDPDQAWVVQLAGVLCNKEEVIKTVNVIIKANGRSMNSHAQAIHGISPEQADRDGLDEPEALSLFADLLTNNPLRICHNYAFDSVFLDQLFERNMDVLSDEHRSKYFLQFPHFCTMTDPRIKKFCNCKNKKGAVKNPRLIELYEKLFNNSFSSQHDAMADVNALRSCYFKLKEMEVI